MFDWWNWWCHTTSILYIFQCLSFSTLRFHDDVIQWKHFPRNWPFVREIHRSPVNFPHKGQWRGALMFSLICVWINDWVNNREAVDLRRYRAHSDVIVMFTPRGCLQLSTWCHHDMKTLSTLLAICEGNPPVTDGSTKGQLGRVLMGFFYVSLNKLFNKQRAGCLWFVVQWCSCEKNTAICLTKVMEWRNIQDCWTI